MYRILGPGEPAVIRTSEIDGDEIRWFIYIYIFLHLCIRKTESDPSLWCLLTFMILLLLFTLVRLQLLSFCAHFVSVCVCVCVRACVRACVRRDWVCARVCVCVCVWEREREIYVMDGTDLSPVKIIYWCLFIIQSFIYFCLTKWLRRMFCRLTRVHIKWLRDVMQQWYHKYVTVVDTVPLLHYGSDISQCCSSTLLLYAIWFVFLFFLFLFIYENSCTEW